MERTCECGCGKSMAIRRPHARFYSPACRVRAHRAAEVIPERMRKTDRWMRWTLAERNGKTTKRPLTIEGCSASSTDPATWTTYAAASRSMVGNGIGFALGEGIGCYDLDDALSDGTLADWAREFIESIPEPVIFSEVSQSGNGVHIFIEATEWPGRVIRDGRKIELYTAGRYIAVTGVRLTL